MRTFTGMEKSLRDALVARSTVLHRHELNGDTLAWVEYEGKRFEVALDEYRGGLIECVIHELLHAVYVHELARWGWVEEDIVLAVERAVMARINRNPTRVKWWRNAIAKKLQSEGDA